NGILIWMWSPLIIICALYLSGKLLIPKFKKLILLIFTILAIIWEILLFFDPLNFLTFKYPDKPGENVIDAYITPGTLGSILGMVGIISLFIFDGVGFLFKTIQSKGVIRKKFLMLSIGIFLYIASQLFEVFFDITQNILFLITVRIGLVSSLWLLYLGIREEPEKPKKLPSDKEVKVKESLFRLTKRPAQITEEEITFHREKKICLMCKGELGGFMFMCKECNALYCGDCAQALSNLENLCWACNAPIDKTKPSKPYKKEEGEVIFEENVLKKGKKQ
ncbi:MAG: hypothetical protein ACFFC1_18205, partial [Promethearchaeota archaeon]